ncbi:DinB family protein [Mucilaginibacter ginsenosidivorans]|uniref:DinB family protein n=1 Tax=Mucilaginibacter ginsenosidivorans TaxID=398053 RepID=A0A5B8V0I0_9SPHI|nr:DinB family protein [Mucilaginibacter ginsenosidivorans]QEC64046.1 DinB family protein [Mucilaginibacter ginsenosidivorans]
MKLKEPIRNILNQLRYVLSELSNEQYMQPVGVLSNSSIGQHNRHILEFFIELNKGYESGIIDYDKRVRNRVIEADKEFALEKIQEIEDSLEKPDRDLILQTEQNDGDSYSFPVFTNYFRELVYNLEHAVHHMALIRIGVNAIADVNVPEEFGVASSTLKYRKTCAQ